MRDRYSRSGRRGAELRDLRYEALADLGSRVAENLRTVEDYASEMSRTTAGRRQLRVIADIAGELSEIEQQFGRVLRKIMSGADARD